MVTLDPRNDATDKETAAKAAEELVAAKVVAVIGPFTSAMAEFSGEPTEKADCESSLSTGYAGNVSEMLAAQPAGLLFIAGALDAARLAHEARKSTGN